MSRSILRVSLVFSLLLVLASFAIRGRAEPTIIIDGIPTKGFPAVKKVQGRSPRGWSLCTGEHIARGVVLTAAHCVYPTEESAVHPSLRMMSVELDSKKTVYAKAVITPGSAFLKKDGLYYFRKDRDLAILVFDDESEGPFLPIAKEAPRVGDPVTAVGFGQNDPQAWFFDGSGTKRYGKNSIATFKSVFIGLIGVAEGGTGWLFSPPSGKQVTTAPGDSGGALLNARNELIGVNTLSGFSNPFLDQESGELRAVHYAINLHSEFAQNFLRQAASQIEGWDYP